MSNNSHHWYGFFLSIMTAILWGVLPITLQLSLVKMDAVTITWYRLAVAALLVFFLLKNRKGLPSLKSLARPHYGFILLAGIGLTLNYVSYLAGLDKLNPETAQVLIQVAPFLLMIGSVLFFEERLSRVEVVGGVVLFLGLLFFFNDKVSLFTSGEMSDYALGFFLVLGAAFTWAAYALSQKLLLKQLTPKQLTLFIYCIGVVALFPFSDLSQVFTINLIQFIALILCCLNTVFAYGAFAEALNVWQASKVSAVIATAPIFTFVSVEVATLISPENFESSQLNLISYLGGGLVVVGSIMAAVGKNREA